MSVLTGGAAQPVHRRPWDAALFVAGTPGQAYTLRVANRTNGRIEVITTVDGRNTLKDEPGHHRASAGFVIPARGFYEFPGFRLDGDSVREFVFGTPGHLDRTIAGQAGDTANVGVFGFAAYREQWPSWTYAGAAGGAPVAAVASASCSVTADSATVARSIGTEMGALREDRVHRASFTRDGEPDILVIGYDTEDALRVMGVIGPPEPNPFPGVGTGYEKYVPAR